MDIVKTLYAFTQNKNQSNRSVEEMLDFESSLYQCLHRTD